jgi:hypothetical protein
MRTAFRTAGNTAATESFPECMYRLFIVYHINMLGCIEEKVPYPYWESKYSLPFGCSEEKD